MVEKRRRIPVRGRLLDDDEDEDDLVGPRTGGTREPRAREPRARERPRVKRPAARRGGSDRAWLRSLLADIPNFLKLLWGLARDPRVSKADKAIVVAALAYAALPADVILAMGFESPYPRRIRSARTPATASRPSRARSRPPSCRSCVTSRTRCASSADVLRVRTVLRKPFLTGALFLP